MAAVGNWHSVLSLFLPCFRLSLSSATTPRGRQQKKLTLNQIVALVPGTESSTQQFGDLDIAGKINKIHIYFLGSLSSFCLVLFYSRCLRKSEEQPRRWLLASDSFGKSSLDRALPLLCGQYEKGFLQV